MNHFYGVIPRFLPIGLQYLGLYGNELTGEVPRSLFDCTSLVALDLGNNKFNDTFPVWLDKLPNLQVLILKSNLFYGQIGDLESEFPFPELRIFDLSFNEFTGTLPSNLFKSFKGMMDEEETGNISTHTDYVYKISLVIKGNEYNMSITSIITSVDLSSNRFEGDIPNSIGSLSSLVLLNLSHNSFGGRIPAEIAKLQALEALDLSRNKLIGEIPGQLLSLTFLEVLNLLYIFLLGNNSIHFQTIRIVEILIYVDFHYRKNMETIMCQMIRHLNRMMMMIHFSSSGFTWEAVVIGYGCGMTFGLLMGGLMFLLEKSKWYVNFAVDIAQQIAAKRQKKRRQRRV